MDFGSPSVDALAAALGSAQEQRATVARAALDRGAAYLQKRDYVLAERSFRMATALDPNSLQALSLLGRTYSRMGRPGDAEAAYRRALALDPTSAEARGDLANLYLTRGRYPEAERELHRLLAADAGAAGAVASLGYVYLETGRLEEAGRQFERAIRLAPRDAAGYYSLGLVRARQGGHREAAALFERALELRRDYAAARGDLAYAHLALGDVAAAKAQVAELLALRTPESLALAAEVADAVRTPGIAYFDIVNSTFNPLPGPQTPVADLDPGLAAPGATVTLAMSFVFSRDMDMASVRNVFNWSITRAAGGDAGVYNHGASLNAGRQIAIGPVPLRVTYDPQTRRATLVFTVTQNAAGDGVMDPSHWVFGFRGTDASGRPMDPDRDQYDWWARAPF